MGSRGKQGNKKHIDKIYEINSEDELEFELTNDQSLWVLTVPQNEQMR